MGAIYENITTRAASRGATFCSEVLENYVLIFSMPSAITFGTSLFTITFTITITFGLLLLGLQSAQTMSFYVYSDLRKLCARACLFGFVGVRVRAQPHPREHLRLERLTYFYNAALK